MIRNANYHGIMVAQRKQAFRKFKKLISYLKPSRILEIGAAQGGFTLFLMDELIRQKLYNSKIRSYDIESFRTHQLISGNAEIIIADVFERIEEIKDFIQLPGTTIVLCDGGDKIKEFNTFAPFLKKGDVIMAHDYSKNDIERRKNFVLTGWSACEIMEKDIEKISKQENLKFYKQEEFGPVIWVCKQKQ